MTEELSPWRRLWEAIEAAKDELWAAEAKAQETFFIKVRLALSEYGREVDPEAFDDYGQPVDSR